MLALLRFVPLAVLTTMVLVRIWWPSFLSTPIWGPFTWFWVAFVFVGWATAWALSPALGRLLGKWGRRAIFPPIVFLGVAVALLWTLDVAWNHLVLPFCGSCGQSSLLSIVTAAIFGA